MEKASWCLIDEFSSVLFAVSILAPTTPQLLSVRIWIIVDFCDGKKVTRRVNARSVMKQKSGVSPFNLFLRTESVFDIRIYLHLVRRQASLQAVDEWNFLLNLSHCFAAFVPVTQLLDYEIWSKLRSEWKCYVDLLLEWKNRQIKKRHLRASRGPHNGPIVAHCMFSSMIVMNWTCICSRTYRRAKRLSHSVIWQAIIINLQNKLISKCRCRQSGAFLGVSKTAIPALALLFALNIDKRAVLLAHFKLLDNFTIFKSFLIEPLLCLFLPPSTQIANAGRIPEDLTFKLKDENQITTTPPIHR